MDHPNVAHVLDAGATESGQMNSSSFIMILAV